jgi:tetratricopeptide (TPR) repeat protein
MLLDEGILLRQNGGWRATTDLGALAVPPTIQALLSARLDRLEPEERAVIQRASVAGQVFWWGAVTELSPESARPDVGARLQSLVRKELIKRDHSAFVADDAFRFGHILIRDAAYAALSKESRANLHEQFAGWLERKAEDRASEYEELVGYHLEQAYRYRTELAVLDDRTSELAPRAGRRLSSAGVRALARGDIAAGRSLLARAVALLPADGPEQLALQPKLALAYKESGELNEAENVLREARRDAASVGNREVELNVLVEQAALYLVSRGIWPDRLLTTVEEAIPSLEELGDDPALAKAWHVIGLGRGLWSGSFAVGEVALERALTHARRAKDRRQEAEILAQLAFAAWAGPTPVDQALRRCHQILERAEGHPTIEAGALRSLAALEARQGRFAESRSLLGRARRTYDELGMRLFSVAVGAFGYGDVEILAGDFEAAERALGDGYSALEQMREKAYVCSVAGYLGGVLYRQGRYEEAERFTSICEQEASPEDIWSQVLFRVTQAKIVARRGDCEQGEALSAEAVNLASMTDIPDLRAGALLDRAETLSLCGRRKEGTPLIEDALGVYEAKGNVVAAKAARAVLRDVLSR